MTRSMKALTLGMWLLAGVVALGFAALWLARPSGSAHGDDAPSDGARLPILFDAPPFELIDQRGRTVTNADFAGAPFVATLFFTECTGPCPMMIGRMNELQSAIADPRVRLVSISVNPTQDTPQVLSDYAARVGAEAGRWFLLTSEGERSIAVALAFRLAVQPASAERPILHAEEFLLVDGRGRVRGIYNHRDEASMSALKRDAARLASATE